MSSNIDGHIHFFKENENNLMMRMQQLQKTLDSEKKMKLELESLDADSDQKLEELRSFIESKSPMVQSVAQEVSSLEQELREIIKFNKEKREELLVQDNMYKELMESEEGRVIGDSIMRLRSSLDNLDLFLVEEGVTLPPSN